MNYTDANDKLTGRNHDRRKIGNNTYLERRDDDIALRLQNTDILLYHPDGKITLNSGGWRTVTTKARINEFLPAEWSLWQERGVWYLAYGNSYQSHHKVAVYDDGTVLSPDGTYTGAESLSVVESKLKLRRRVAKYSKDYVTALFDGKVPAPGAGDCFYCQLKSADGRTMGENFRDDSHILSHLDEKYYVPSLLTRAFEVMPVSQVMKWAVGEKWYPDQFPQNGHSFADKWIKQQIAKTINRYMLRQLGQAS